MKKLFARPSYQVIHKIRKSSFGLYEFVSLVFFFFFFFFFFFLEKSLLSRSSVCTYKIGPALFAIKCCYDPFRKTKTNTCANSVDPDETAVTSHLIRTYTAVLFLIFDWNSICISGQVQIQGLEGVFTSETGG